MPQAQLNHDAEACLGLFARTCANAERDRTLIPHRRLPFEPISTEVLSHRHGVLQEAGADTLASDLRLDVQTVKMCHICPRQGE